MKIFLSILLFINFLKAEFIILAEDFPPFQYEKDGELKGVSTAIVRKILSEVKHRDNIEIQSWSKAYESVKNGSGYALFSTSRTQEREEVFKWVGPIAKATNSFYLKSDNNIKLENLEDIKKLTIGAGDGQASTLMLEAKGLGDNLKIYEEERSVYGGLLNGEVDIIPVNDMTFAFRINQIGLDKSEFKKSDYKIYDNELYIAFSKDTPNEVIEHWQKVLDVMIESYEYETIYTEAMREAYVDFSVDAPEEYRKPDSIKVIKGEWNMYGSSSDIDIDLLKDECIGSVWIYRDKNWVNLSKANIEVIPKNQAFWLLGKEDCYLNLKK